MPLSSAGPPTLILVPTELEQRQLAGLGGLAASLGELALCGFGPVSAAACAAQRICMHRPRRALLLGIAGSYTPERAPLASAHSFARVELEGVGVGQGADFLSPARLGFARAEGTPGSDLHDSLTLVGAPGNLLLTTCAASASAAEAAARRARHPEALAEDMEAFGVALACRLMDVPLVVVRGISNLAGERDHAAWKVREAMGAARELALDWLRREDWTVARASRA